MPRRYREPLFDQQQEIVLGNLRAGVLHPPVLTLDQLDSVIDGFHLLPIPLAMELLQGEGADWAVVMPDGMDLQDFLDVVEVPAERQVNVHNLFVRIFDRILDRFGHTRAEHAPLVGAHALFLLVTGAPGARRSAEVALRLDPTQPLAMLVLLATVSANLAEPVEHFQ